MQRSELFRICFRIRDNVIVVHPLYVKNFLLGEAWIYWNWRDLVTKLYRASAAKNLTRTITSTIFSPHERDPTMHFLENWFRVREHVRDCRENKWTSAQIPERNRIAYS